MGGLIVNKLVVNLLTHIWTNNFGVTFLSVNLTVITVNNREIFCYKICR